jgi:signal transduction histidine kinase
MAVPLRAGGRLIGLVAMSRGRPDAPYSAGELALLEALTERAEMAIVTAQSLQAAEAEHRRLEAVLVEAERARDALEVEVLERRRGEVRQRCLTEATAVLASSLEHEQAGENRLGAVAGCLVPHVAEWCAIDLLGPDVSRSAGAHADPAKTELVRELRTRWPPTETRCGFLGVMRTRRAALCTEVSDEALDAEALDAEQLATLRELGVRSMVVAPIQTGELVMGALTLMRGRADQRRFDDADLRFAEELARRIAISLHNADLYQAARAAVGTRDEFLSIASHELKTPLTSLQLLLQQLHAAALKGPVAQPLLCDRLGRAERQVSRVETLIRELLDASRLSQGRYPMQRIQLDLAEVTRAVVTRLEELADRGRCPVRLSTDPTIGHWDRKGLEQVIENLLVNAIKYGAGAPIEVTVSCDDRHAVLQVTDGGIGIAADDQERIFGRFERAVSARNYGGLGIGLWLVRRLVEEHQGNVTVESTPARGSTFRVQLPRSQAGVGDG